MPGKRTRNGSGLRGACGSFLAAEKDLEDQDHLVCSKAYARSAYSKVWKKAQTVSVYIYMLYLI